MSKKKAISIITLLLLLIIALITHIKFLSDELAHYRVKSLECHVEIGEIRSELKKSEIENVLMRNRLQRSCLFMEI